MSNVPTLHSDEYILFCCHLRATLKKCGYTQAQLAEKLDRPQSYVSKCLSRERRMGIVEIYKMCRVIDISLTDFAKEIEEIFDGVQEEKEDISLS